ILHDITGIPLAALRNCPLDKFTISKRERWVENRRTTEEEDIVYCLLGILGVSMTTLAIVGPGGTGKSQLALEVAYRTRQDNKDCSVFWIDASDKGSPYQSYARVAQKLSISGWDNDQADVK
ncbi:hypothetical protein GQ44DRAFT_637694, partial [Phaeosphaeriaceae sp. PMI808]